MSEAPPSVITNKFKKLVSLDGNYAMRVAKYGMVASSNGQVRLPSAGCYEAFEASLLNQILYWWGI